MLAEPGVWATGIDRFLTAKKQIDKTKQGYLLSLFLPSLRCHPASPTYLEDFNPQDR
jgi:hypothetical protein